MGKKIDSNDLLDLVEDLGLSERQQIGTLLDAVEDEEEPEGEEEE